MRRLCRSVAIILLSLLTVAAGAFLLLALEREPQLLITVDTKKDLPQLAAWSPDGQRLAFGTERELNPFRARAGEDAPRFYPAEVWLLEMAKLNKKPRRLLDYREVRSLNYRIDRLSWAPDGTRLAAEMTHRRLGTATFFFTEKGKLARLGGNKRFNFVMGYGGGWMADSVNYGLLTEALPPKLLHQVSLLRVDGGRLLARFRPDTFAAVAWLPQKQQIVGIKRDREFAEPPQLVLGDLGKSTLKELGEEPDFQGRLAVSPDEKLVSFFTAYDTLTVKNIETGEKAASLPVPLGAYKWSPLGDAVYYLEPAEIGDNTGRLMRVDLVTKQKSEVLGPLLYDFWLSPDASHIAVVTATEETELRIYRLR